MCFDILSLLPGAPPSLRLMFVGHQVGMTRRQGQEYTGKKNTERHTSRAFLAVRKYINKGEKIKSLTPKSQF